MVHTASAAVWMLLLFIIVDGKRLTRKKATRSTTSLSQELTSIQRPSDRIVTGESLTDGEPIDVQQSDGEPIDVQQSAGTEGTPDVTNKLERQVDETPKTQEEKKVPEERTSSDSLPDLPQPTLNLGLKIIGKLDTKVGDTSKRHLVDAGIMTAGFSPQVLSKAKEYAFAYPNDNFPSGAFIYYDKEGKVIAIKAVVPADEDTPHSTLTFELKAKGKLSDLTERRGTLSREAVWSLGKGCSSSSEGYHDITLFEDAEQYCWIPECKIVKDSKVGCFMYKMKNQEYRAYLISAAPSHNMGLIVVVAMSVVMALGTLFAVRRSSQ